MTAGSDVDVDPREPEVFGIQQAKSASVARTTSATSRSCGHPTPGTGSDDSDRRDGRIGGPMRVQFEAGETAIHASAAGVRGTTSGRAAGRKTQRDDLDPGRSRLWRALLVEELTIGPVRYRTSTFGLPPAAPAHRQPRRGSTGRRPACGRLGKKNLGGRDRDFEPREISLSALAGMCPAWIAPRGAAAGRRLLVQEFLMGMAGRIPSHR
jgi:hypothetical protein